MPEFARSIFYFSTGPSVTGFVTIAISFLSIVAIMLMVWQAVVFLLKPPRMRRWAALSFLIVFFGTGYTILYAMDIPTILSIVTITGGDVPILSTLRGAFITGLLFTMTRVISSIRRLEVNRETP